jgi:hypothetical protein
MERVLSSRTFRSGRVAKMIYSETDEPDATHQCRRGRSAHGVHRGAAQTENANSLQPSFPPWAAALWLCHSFLCVIKTFQKRLIAFFNAFMPFLPQIPDPFVTLLPFLHLLPLLYCFLSWTGWAMPTSRSKQLTPYNCIGSVQSNFICVAGRRPAPPSNVDWRENVAANHNTHASSNWRCV